MKIVLILAALAVVISASPANARCVMSYCQDTAATTPAPGERRAITNTSRQRQGDLYNPGHGRRLQLRNNHRQIIGYVEKSGTITDTHRRKVGKVEK